MRSFGRGETRTNDFLARYSGQPFQLVQLHWVPLGWMPYNGSRIMLVARVFQVFLRSPPSHVGGYEARIFSGCEGFPRGSNRVVQPTPSVAGLLQPASLSLVNQ